jgi:mono/diheme cytochrome c family protein
VTRLALVALASAAALAGPADAYTPEVDYALHCEGCHLADGSATPGKVPALAGSLARFLRVPGGREYLARVPGVANAPLSDAELAALLDWTLRRFDGAALPPDFAPYTAREVHALREQPLVDVRGARDALLGSPATREP